MFELFNNCIIMHSNSKTEPFDAAVTSSKCPNITHLNFNISMWPVQEAPVTKHWLPLHWHEVKFFPICETAERLHGLSPEPPSTAARARF